MKYGKTHINQKQIGIFIATMRRQKDLPDLSNRMIVALAPGITVNELLSDRAHSSTSYFFTKNISGDLVVMSSELLRVKVNREKEKVALFKDSELSSFCPSVRYHFSTFYDTFFSDSVCIFSRRFRSCAFML